MKNEFKEVMSQRTDEELITIVTIERDGYNPIAIDAAEAEIKKRNIDTNTFTKVEEKVTIEKEKKKKVKSNVVDTHIRFVNFIIDHIVWYGLLFMVSFIIGLFIQPMGHVLIKVLGYSIFLGTYIAYYALMEIKFQKTVGKFITKTKVVKMDGEKLETSDIITRSLCRLIPFDALSFLYTKNGFHDSLSNTTVVNDSMES